MRKRFLIPALFAGALGAAFVALRTPDTDPKEMRAKYGGEKALFAATEGGLNIHYRDEGDPEGPALILLHGSNASLHTWEKLVELLGEEHRLISYDQPGHGLTGPAPDDDYSASGMMRALDAVTEAAGAERFYIVGNSMGGWVAWRYALEHPDRTIGLILIDAAGAPPQPDDPKSVNIGFALARNPLAQPILAHVTPRALVKKSVEQTFFDPTLVDEAMTDRYWELLRYPGNRRATAIRAASDREPAKFNHLGALAAPTLILWGEKDRQIPASAAARFDAAIPDSEAIIYPDVGHIPMEEAPIAVAGDIRRFVARVNATKGGD